MTDEPENPRATTDVDSALGHTIAGSRELPSTYESRVVGFIDILGFRSLLARMSSAPELFQTITEVLNTVMDYGAATHQAGLFSDTALAAGLSLTAFSDCFVISARAGNEVGVTSVCRQIVLSLLEIGVPSRGAIVRGRLYHSHPLVFGEGLVRAYELESTAAVYPRVVVTEDVVAAIQAVDRQDGTTIADGLLRDIDGLYFLDAFWTWPAKYRLTVRDADGNVRHYAEDDALLRHIMALAHISAFKRVRGHLVESLNRERSAAEHAAGRLAKLRWLASRLNDAIARDIVYDVTPIDIDSPRQEPDWNESVRIRTGRDYRPVKLPFTVSDVLNAYGKPSAGGGGANP